MPAAPDTRPCRYEPGTVKDTLTPLERSNMVENDQYRAFVRRILRAYRRRVGDGDLDELAGLVELRAELDEAMQACVTQLRDSWGYSWAEVAGVLGVTRQAAQQRYGR